MPTRTRKERGVRKYMKFAPRHAAEVEFSLKSRMKKAEPLADPA